MHGIPEGVVAHEADDGVDASSAMLSEARLSVMEGRSHVECAETADIRLTCELLFVDPAYVSSNNMTLALWNVYDDGDHQVLMEKSAATIEVVSKRLEHAGYNMQCVFLDAQGALLQTARVHVSIVPGTFAAVRQSREYACMHVCMYDIHTYIQTYKQTNTGIYIHTYTYTYVLHGQSIQTAPSQPSKRC
jgi:hypothetical protein